MGIALGVTVFATAAGAIGALAALGPAGPFVAVGILVSHLRIRYGRTIGTSLTIAGLHRSPAPLLPSPN